MPPQTHRGVVRVAKQQQKLITSACDTGNTDTKNKTGVLSQ